MFESNMDEYLDEEIESVKGTLEVICKDWERKVCFAILLSDIYLNVHSNVDIGLFNEFVHFS